MNKFNLCVYTLLLLFLTISCSMMKDSKAAEPAVEKFHNQFNAKEFSAIYNQAGDQMKVSATEKQLTDLLDAVYRKLGPYKSSKAVSWRVNAGPLTSMVTLVYDTEFSEGKGTEQFVISVSGDTTKLEGYHINSADLITK
jgi:signal-transduction protein with cAMP-binding, CBS, and nucleotidyltransferase domain